MTSCYLGAALKVSGIDAPTIIEKYILQNGKIYFYGTKNSEAVWTYEKRLALAITKHEAEALAFWLRTIGITVEQVSV